MFTTITNPGAVLAFGAALAYCGQNVGVRALLDGGITVWGLLFTRGLMGLVVVAAAAWLFHVNVLGKNRRLLLFIGLCGSASSACTTMAIATIPLYQALVLLYLYPALSVPLNFLVNRTRMRKGDGLWVLMAFAGCVLLIWPDEAKGLSLSLGHLVGFAAASLYSLAYVCVARLGTDNSGLEPLCYYSLWSVAGVGVFMLVSGHDPGLDNLRAVASGLGVGLVALAGLLMGYAALRWIEPYKVGTIGTLEVFGGAVSSWLLFHDPMSPRALLGGLVILFVALRLRRA
jgi:Predicted permease, DMT superfamily